MTQKITNPNKGDELVAKEKPCINTTSHSTEEIDALNMYWLACSYPFMPMIDLAIVFDKLKKSLKNWFLNKRDRTNHYKKKIHETI